VVDLGQALSEAINRAHDQGGRPVGSPRVPSDSQEPVSIASVWYGPDACYVKVKRQGQTATTTYIPWVGSIAPVALAKATLVKPMGNANIGWVQPKTVASA
jgi:hypothetical protein